MNEIGLSEIEQVLFADLRIALISYWKIKSGGNSFELAHKIMNNAIKLSKRDKLIVI